MKKIVTLLAVLSVIYMTGCGGSKIASGKTLIDVNGEKITEGHLQFLASLNPNLAHQLSSPFGKKQLLDNLVEQELLYQAAKKEGLERDPGTEAKIDLYRKVILAQAFIDAQGEKEAQKYYNEHKDEFEQFGLAHIMIPFATPEETKAAQKAKKPSQKMRTEQEALKLANQIYDRLKKGEKFEALAKQFSEDEMSKEQGGAFGPVAKNDQRLIRRGFQPLLEKGLTLKVGEMAGPIKTTSGYHIVTVTSPLEMAPFAEVKDQLLFRQRGEIRNKLLTDLKTKGKIVYAEELQPKNEEPGTKNDATEGGVKEAPTGTPPGPQGQGQNSEQTPH